MWGVYTHLLKDGYKESVLLGVPPPNFLVNWVPCKAMGLWWRAGPFQWAQWGSAWSKWPGEPVTFVGSHVVPQSMADVVLQWLLPGAEHLPRGGHWAPPTRWNPSCAGGFNAHWWAHTWDVALHIGNVFSLPLVALVYNKEFYAKVALNKGLKVTCVGL